MSTSLRANFESENFLWVLWKKSHWFEKLKKAVWDDEGSSPGEGPYTSTLKRNTSNLYLIYTVDLRLQPVQFHNLLLWVGSFDIQLGEPTMKCKCENR